MGEVTPLPMEIRTFLESHITGIRWSGDQGEGTCPLHDDHHASLSVNADKLVWCCHAGCGGGSLKELASRMGWPYPFNGSGKREVARYDYRDAGGRVVYQVVRFEPKEFRHYDPNKKAWNCKGIERLPYRLPELLEGINAGRHAFIVEGEKDVETLQSLGLIATCNPGGVGGAGLWKDFSRFFPKGSRVVLVPDADEPGQKLMAEVSQCLLANECEAKKLDLGYPITSNHGKDVSNWLAEGHTKNELIALAENAPIWQATTTVGGKPAVKREKQGDRLIALAADTELFHDGEVPYAVIDVGDHHEVLSVRTLSFRRWLAKAFWQETGSAPGSQAVQDAIDVLSARATFDGPDEKVHVRIAGDDMTVWVDLCNEKWEAVKITARGWEVIQNPPVRFRRRRGMRSLPNPERTGKLGHLDEFLNLHSKGDRKLISAWLLGAFRPCGPYPVLCLHGEQGSAKSITARMLRELIDPNDTSLRSAPREERDLVLAATNGWIVVLDNLSHLPLWLSDALCRISTGGGFATRELYSDDEEVLFAATRPIILTGIEALATRGDLADRAIVVNLPAIPDEKRVREEELLSTFAKARPHIFGALLDAVAAALLKSPSVSLSSVPRMADFAYWVVAAEGSLGWEPGSFLAAYRANRAEATQNVIDSSLVATALVGMMDGDEDIEAAPTSWLENLTETVGEKVARSPAWPKSTKALAGEMKRLAPSLREEGIEIEWRRSNKTRTIHIFRTKGKVSVNPSPSVISVTRPGENGDTMTDGDAKTDVSRLVLNHPGAVAIEGDPSPEPPAERDFVV